jgi:hypothetical protein
VKRLRPNAYKQEAKSRIDKVTIDLVSRHGAWNAEKIEQEMYHILRDRRKSV